MSTTDIHSTAIVHPSAKLGAGTCVGPYAVIGEHVVCGKNNRIGSHVVIEGHTEIGNENVIYQFASIGAAPQDLKYKGEPSKLIIGHKNIIREYVSLQPGTQGGGMLTQVGDGNLFMVNSHLGHDCHVGNGNIIANSAAIAGHVRVGNFVTIGGLAGIHQFVRLGDYCLLGAGSMVNKDVPPFCSAQGDRAGLYGVNKIGLERRGFTPEDVSLIKKLYRMIFLGSGTFASRVEAAKSEVGSNVHAQAFLAFLQSSERGVTACRGESQD